jgi:hypothetical protein
VQSRFNAGIEAAHWFVASASCAAKLFAGIDAASMSLGMSSGERTKTSRNHAHIGRSGRAPQQDTVRSKDKTNRESANACAAIGRLERRFSHGRPSKIMARRIRIDRTCRVDIAESPFARFAIPGQESSLHHFSRSQAR